MEGDKNLFPISEVERTRMRRDLIVKEKEFEDLASQQDALKENVKELTDEMKKLRKGIVAIVNALDEKE